MAASILGDYLIPRRRAQIRYISLEGMGFDAMVRSSARPAATATIRMWSIPTTTAAWAQLADGLLPTRRRLYRSSPLWRACRAVPALDYAIRLDSHSFPGGDRPPGGDGGWPQRGRRRSAAGSAVAPIQRRNRDRRIGGEVLFLGPRPPVIDAADEGHHHRVADHVDRIAVVARNGMVPEPPEQILEIGRVLARA